MKLTADEKMIRANLKGELNLANGELFTDRDFGLTVAVVPAIAGEDFEFFHVAVSRCDLSTDKFSRKRGEFVALDRWYSGEVIAIPRYNRPAAEVAELVFELLR